MENTTERMIVCLECGALIGDTVKHDEWHEKVDPWTVLR